MSEEIFEAAVFDLDGVITQTARVHFKAWKEVFEDVLERHQTDEEFEAFEYADDYVPYVDGKPRYAGVKSFLDSRDLSLPYGRPSDDPDEETICGVGNRKNKRFRELAAEDGVTVFDSTIALVHELRKRGVRTGVISSSRNCTYILEQAEIKDLFDTIVDGTVSRELDLDGKPAPDVFRVAADNLSASPDRCIGVEDALSGIESARRANYGLVLGVCRHEDCQEMYAYGADIIVDDLSEFSIEDARNWFETEKDRDSWNLTYFGFEPKENRLREALTTVGNGYFGTRGAMASEDINDDRHYPGTYIMGLFNKLPTEVHGKEIWNNDFVNLPNWLSLKIRIADDPFLSVDEATVVSFRQNLNLRTGITRHELRLRDKKGRTTRIDTERFASIEEPHRAVLAATVTPEDYEGKVTIRSALDGTVINYGVERYRDLSRDHLDHVDASDVESGVHLAVRTKNSKIDIHMVTNTRLFAGDTALAGAQRTVVTDDRYAAEEWSFDAEEGTEYRVEKLVGISTSKEYELEDPDDPARPAYAAVATTDSYAELVQRQRAGWDELWDRADFVIDGDRFAQETIRLHIYHLLATANRNNTKIDAGMTARGLHGEAYRGHFFWDELFTQPFYNLHFPDVVKGFLMYRYRRLDAAREYAREYGFRGAMYPWQAADTGGEESQEIHYNPRSGEWDPDLSRNQRHISIAVGYNVWTYFYATDDAEFIHDYGMEMLLEIARFWASIARYEEQDGRFHISGVMGPDEFHEKYPGAEEGGFKDNAYTNVMTAWLLHKIVETWEHLPAEVQERLADAIDITDSEIEDWKAIVRGLAVRITDDGIIEQFEGWQDLEELDWQYYGRKYDNIRRMDRILKAEGDSPDKYKAIKQADVLQMYYLLSPGQVRHTLDLMGYTVDDETKLLRRQYEHYVPRTSHGSTLSYVVHAAIARYIPGKKSDTRRWFMEALKSDVFDTQGGTTLEGIHCGVMAGTVEILMKNFAGLNLFPDRVMLNPSLPRGWKCLSFKILHRGRLFQLEIDQNHVKVSKQALSAGGQGETYIQVGAVERAISEGETLEIEHSARVYKTEPQHR